MLALSRRLGWGVLFTVLLSVGPLSAAKPVGQVWTEMKGFRLLVVSPESPASTAWVQTALNNLPVRVLHPRDYDPRRSLQAGEQVCLLFSAEQKGEWPAALLGSLPRNPSTVAADEVLVSCRVIAKGVWETTITAPDHDQVQAAFIELLRMDSVQFDKSPSAMLSWKLVEALGIGTNGPLLSGWLSYQGSQFQRLRAVHNSPVNINPEKLRSVGLSAVAITYAEWRDLGGPTQDILKGLLPGNVAEALVRGDETMVVSGIETVNGKLRVGVCAPNDRFLRAVLPSIGEANAPASTPEAAATRLTSLKSPGGTWELKDLRPYPKVVVVAAQLGGERQEIALDLAYKLRRSLAETGRWQFIDDQALEASIRRQLQEGAFGQGTKINAAGADAIIVARLHHVERRTEFAEAPARRLTNPPADFTEGEPGKPDPDARLYVFAGPKVYPQGVNDPKYQQDLQTYNTKWNEWRQRRDQYVANFNAAEVVWEQTLLTRQAVRLDGILEVFSRDGLLVCSTPINSGLRTEARQPRQVTVRGFGTAPNALPLPAAQETVPDAMLNEASAQAAKETAAGLVLMALTPRDGGRPAVVVTEPGTGPTKPVSGGPTRQTGGTPGTPSAPGGPQLVEVDGVGQLGDGEDAAKRQALNDALRNAVEKVIGTYVESSTLVDKYQLVEDRIMTRANGFAAVREIVKQSREGGALTLTCQVEVMYKPIRDALVAMGIARQWRVMVCIPEQHLRRVVPDPAAENAMMRQLIAAGLPVIDQRQSAELRNNQELLLRIAGNPTLAAQLRAKYNAEVLVTGEAFSQDIDPIAGQAACRARLEIKAIDLNTAEVLAAEDQHSTGTDQTSELAGKVALRKAADEISERFIDMIYRRPMPTAGMARVEITITGFKGFTAADRFKKNLAKLPGVSAVRQLEFAQGLLKVEVELNHAQAENLPVLLESDPSMKEFKIGVQSVTTSTIVGQAGP